MFKHFQSFGHYFKFAELFFRGSVKYLFFLESVTDDYSPASPDLNAIESVRTWMNQYVQKNRLNSQQRLKRLDEQTWNVISQSVIRGYINNIPNICTEILANNGWQGTE